MKTILAIILLASCSVAAAQEHDPLAAIRGSLDMYNAQQWGKVYNKIAREAPPQRYDLTIRQAPSAPVVNYPKSNYAPAPSGSIYSNGGYNLEALAKALAAKPEKHANSPFNDSYLPGVE